MRHLSAVLVLALSASASAELVTDGAFENPSVGGQFASYDSVLTPNGVQSWTITNGSIDHIGTYWPGADGGQSLDMSGTNAGTISQNITTTSGQQYTLSFWFSGNPDGNGLSLVRSLQYDVNGGTDLTGQVTHTATSSQSRASQALMEWQFFSVTFIASTTGSVALTFTSLESSAFGATLDDVSVLESPEPGAFLLFGLGLGGLGLWRRTLKAKARAKKA